MDTILTINIVIAVVFTCCYAYQLFFFGCTVHQEAGAS